MTENIDFTNLLSAWIAGDIGSGERLKALIYHHCHCISKQHIQNKRKNSKGFELKVAESLNTTSLLHNALLDLVPPKEMFQNRSQFFDYLSLVIRNLMLDEIKKQSAQKRGFNIEHTSLTSFVNTGSENEFLDLDMALNQLAKASEECARIFNLYYFLGLKVEEIVELTGCKSNSIYKQIKAGKAFVLSVMDN